MGTAPSEACPGRGRTVAAVVLPGARWSPSELRLRVEGAPLATATSTWFWQSDHLLSVVSERVARVSDVANSRFTGRVSALYRPGKCRLVERHHPAAVTQRAKWPFRLAVRCQTCQVANLPDLENAPRQPHRRPERSQWHAETCQVANSERAFAPHGTTRRGANVPSGQFTELGNGIVDVATDTRAGSTGPARVHGRHFAVGGWEATPNGGTATRTPSSGVARLTDRRSADPRCMRSRCRGRQLESSSRRARDRNAPHRSRRSDRQLCNGH